MANNGDTNEYCFMKKTPTLDGTDYISICSEYFRISKAAELLGCTAEELLHLGVNYQIEILAPVFSEGIYRWAIEHELAGFPEIVGPVEHYFNASDRVLLSREDLAKIEAVGWAIPTFFYAPSKAQEFDDLLLNARVPAALNKLAPEGTFTISRHRADTLISSITYSPTQLLKPDSELIPTRKAHYYSAWYSDTELAVCPEKTTITNLFISKVELERLNSGQSTGDANVPIRRPIFVEPNKHVERHAADRESILVAAIYCKKEWPENCKEISDWARTIELNAKLFWPVDMKPPREPDGVIDLLRAATKGDVLSQKNKK